jgi:biotin operon repressor
LDEEISGVGYDAMTGMHIRDRRGGERYFIDNLFIREYGKIVGPYGIAVYNALAVHADIDDQEAWPSYETIAALIGCSRRQVIRVVQQLQGLQIIQVSERKTKDGRRTSNGITLLHKDEWTPVSSDSQSPPAVTHSHPASDSESPEQDSCKQDPSNKDGASPEAPESVTNSRKEPDFLPPADEQMKLLFSSLTNPDGGPRYDQAEKDLLASGWNIRSKPIKDAAIHFLAATGWEVPSAVGVRRDWIKTFTEHITEFGLAGLHQMYQDIAKSATYNLGRPGSFTKEMLSIKNARSSDRKHVADDWMNDPQYRTFAELETEDYKPW